MDGADISMVSYETGLCWEAAKLLSSLFVILKSSVLSEGAEVIGIICLIMLF